MRASWVLSSSKDHLAGKMKLPAAFVQLFTAVLAWFVDHCTAEASLQHLAFILDSKLDDAMGALASEVWSGPHIHDWWVCITRLSSSGTVFWPRSAADTTGVGGLRNHRLSRPCYVVGSLRMLRRVSMTLCAYMTTTMQF